MESSESNRNVTPDAVAPARMELVQRALAILVAERERTGANVTDEALERTSERLGLNPAEILRVRKDAETEGLFDDNEDHDDDINLEQPDHVEVQSDLVDRMMQHSLLTPDGERELGRAARMGQAFLSAIECGSIEDLPAARKAVLRGRQAQQSLILCNVRLAMDIARRYEGLGLDRDDLLQEGILGLMRAVETFDPELGFRFSTYATWWIRQSITRAIANTGRTVRFPAHVAERITKMRRTEKRLCARTGRDKISAKELADELGWPIESVGKLLVLDAQRFLSANHEDETETSLLERLQCPLPDPEASAIESDFRRFLEQCIDGLDPRAAEVMRLRFGLESGSSKTLEAVGKRFNVTRERIRQIEAKSLRRLGSAHGNELELFIKERQ